MTEAHLRALYIQKMSFADCRDWLMELGWRYFEGERQTRFRDPEDMFQYICTQLAQSERRASPPPRRRVVTRARRKTEICRNWERGECHYPIERCRYAHGPDDLQHDENESSLKRIKSQE